MDAEARIEALERENERLQGRIEDLELALGVKLLAPLDWRLTAQEMRVFGALLTRDLMSKEGLMAALYTDRRREEVEIKIVDVFVCKLRKKIGPLGMAIETVWGQGYRMPAAAKARAHELMIEAAA